jgi:ribosomal protein S18 acetylase RimI-like enzyme
LQNKHLLGADTCLVILHNQQLVGYCLAHPWKQGLSIDLEQRLSPLAEPDCLYLHDIAILPQAQGLGIGKQVLSRLVDSAQRLGLKSLCLVAVQGAQSYWAKQGFSRQDGTQSLASYPHGAVTMHYCLS